MKSYCKQNPLTNISCEGCNTEFTTNTYKLLENEKNDVTSETNFRKVLKFGKPYATIESV